MTGLFKTLFLIFFFCNFKSKSYKTNIGSYFKSLFCFLWKGKFRCASYFAFHIFFFWTMPLRTYESIKIYIHENMGRLLKLFCLKKNLIFCNRKLKCLQYLKQIRKAKGHFKTQFLIIFFFFTTSNPNHIKTLGLFSNLIFAIYEKKMFLCTMHSVFHFCFWTMPLI